MNSYFLLFNRTLKRTWSPDTLGSKAHYKMLSFTLNAIYRNNNYSKQVTCCMISKHYGKLLNIKEVALNIHTCHKNKLREVQNIKHGTCITSFGLFPTKNTPPIFLQRVFHL